MNLYHGAFNNCSGRINNRPRQFARRHLNLNKFDAAKRSFGHAKQKHENDKAIHSLFSDAVVSTFYCLLTTVYCLLLYRFLGGSWALITAARAAFTF